VAEPPFEATVHHGSPAAVPRFAFALMIRPSRDEGHDRIGLWQTDSALTIALADGAGGVVGAATAALSLLNAVDISPTPALQASDIISALDRRLASTNGGQSTAVVLTLSADGVAGASVGDSGAWVMFGSPGSETGCRPSGRSGRNSACSARIARGTLIGLSREHDDDFGTADCAVS
jgi:hypothetical protein